jgi:hypothetical protein
VKDSKRSKAALPPCLLRSWGLLERTYESLTKPPSTRVTETRPCDRDKAESNSIDASLSPAKTQPSQAGLEAPPPPSPLKGQQLKNQESFKSLIVLGRLSHRSAEQGFELPATLRRRPVSGLVAVKHRSPLAVLMLGYGVRKRCWYARIDAGMICRALLIDMHVCRGKRPN